MARSRDASRHVMGRCCTKPILDTRMYQVEFAGGKVTELTTNVIAEPMHTHCNAVGNEYLLLDALIDYQKDNKAISLTGHKMTVQGRPVAL